MIVKIKEKKEIAKDYLQVTFDSSGQELNFKAGQFCKVTLVNPPRSDDRGNSRFLGFTTSPSEKSTFSVLTRKGVSAFKKSLEELPIGTEVELGGIDGRINNLPEDHTQRLVFLAGGIGIAPIMSVLRFFHENSWPYEVTLIYINEDRESAAFLEELNSFKNESTKFHLVSVMTNEPDWTGEKREIDTQFIKDHFPRAEKYLYFITGTPKFVPNIFRQIQEAGVPVSNIKMEIFTGY